MKSNELKDKSSADLQKELISLLREQFNLRIQKGIGQSPKPHLFTKVRKQIARVKTYLTEKEGSLL